MRGIASITVVGGPVLRGIGKPQVEMKISILSFCSFSLLLMIFIRYGLVAVAYTELLRVLIVESIRVLALKKYLKIEIGELVRKLMPTVKALLIMVLVIVIFDYLIVIPNVYISFISKILLGMISYGAIYIFNKNEIEGLLHKIKFKGVKNEKILIVNSYYAPNILGGAEISTQLLAEDLKKEYKVCILTTGAQKSGIIKDEKNGVEILGYHA